MTATEFQRIPKEQLEDIPSMQEVMIRQMAAKADEFYKKVLRQLLGREPTIEDFKEVALVSHINYPDQELIAYKGHPFGRITKGFKPDDYCAYTWTFEPIPTFKKDATI